VELLDLSAEAGYHGELGGGNSRVTTSPGRWSQPGRLKAAQEGSKQPRKAQSSPGRLKAEQPLLPCGLAHTRAFAPSQN